MKGSPTGDTPVNNYTLGSSETGLLAKLYFYTL